MGEHCGRLSGEWPPRVRGGGCGTRGGWHGGGWRARARRRGVGRKRILCACVRACVSVCVCVCVCVCARVHAFWGGSGVVRGERGGRGEAGAAGRGALPGARPPLQPGRPSYLPKSLCVSPVSPCLQHAPRRSTRSSPSTAASWTPPPPPLPSPPKAPSSPPPPPAPPLSHHAAPPLSPSSPPMTTVATSATRRGRLVKLLENYRQCRRPIFAREIGSRGRSVSRPGLLIAAPAAPPLFPVILVTTTVAGGTKAAPSTRKPQRTPPPRGRCLVPNQRAHPGSEPPLPVLLTLTVPSPTCILASPFPAMTVYSIGSLPSHVF